MEEVKYTITDRVVLNYIKRIKNKITNIYEDKYNR